MVDWHLHIESNPKVLLGKPVIKGTRVGVDLILEKLAAGETEQDILESFPFITADAIKASLAYGAQSVRLETLYEV